MPCSTDVLAEISVYYHRYEKCDGDGDDDDDDGGAYDSAHHPGFLARGICLVNAHGVTLVVRHGPHGPE